MHLTFPKAGSWELSYSKDPRAPDIAVLWGWLEGSKILGFLRAGHILGPSNGHWLPPALGIWLTAPPCLPSLPFQASAHQFCEVTR
jgi:hypothetical protein